MSKVRIQANGRKYKDGHPILLNADFITKPEYKKQDESQPMWFQTLAKAHAYAIKQVEQGRVRWLHIYDRRSPFGMDLAIKWTLVNGWNHDLNYQPVTYDTK